MTLKLKKKLIKDAFPGSRFTQWNKCWVYEDQNGIISMDYNKCKCIEKAYELAKDSLL